MAAPENLRNYQYSPAAVAKASLDVSIGGAVDFTWNGYWRAVYEKNVLGLEEQANQFVDRGIFTFQEAATWVNTQRNALVAEYRRPLTPFGQFWSEKVKPLESLPKVDDLYAKKGSYEAILRSGARTRQSVNKIAFMARSGGPALITIESS